MQLIENIPNKDFTVCYGFVADVCGSSLLAVQLQTVTRHKSSQLVINHDL